MNLIKHYIDTAVNVIAQIKKEIKKQLKNTKGIRTIFKNITIKIH